MLFSAGKKTAPWETLGYRSVEPVPIECDEDTEEDFDLAHISEEEMTRTYTFNVTQQSQYRNSIIFARQLFVQEMFKSNYNVLLTEGWQVTLLRRGKEYRTEVRYTGRPGRVLNNGSFSSKPHRNPPFLEMLDAAT